MLWWASNFNDNYKLVDVVQGQPLTNEFAPGATLNEAGLAFKQYDGVSAAPSRPASGTDVTWIAPAFPSTATTGDYLVRG